MQTMMNCGRCGVRLTSDELDNQRYEDRMRCNVCDCMTGTSDFLTFASIHSPSKEEAEREWVRRVDLNEPVRLTFRVR